MADDLFNAAVKALKASEKMSDTEYIQAKEHVLAECAELGKRSSEFYT